jgi:hypothetical protein
MPVAAMFAIVLLWIAVVLIVVTASGRLPKGSEKESDRLPDAENAQVPPGTPQSVAGDGNPR